MLEFKLIDTSFIKFLARIAIPKISGNLHGISRSLPTEAYLEFPKLLQRPVKCVAVASKENLFL